MNTGVGPARIGQWYTRWDKGETSQVTGFDDESGAIEVQAFDGDLDEIDRQEWAVMPLGFAEPPEDCTGPLDDIEHDDLGYSETDMSAEDWGEPLQPFRAPEDAQAASETDELESGN